MQVLKVYSRWGDPNTRFAINTEACKASMHREKLLLTCSALGAYEYEHSSQRTEEFKAVAQLSHCSISL
jgi:hypothetical protein